MEHLSPEQIEEYAAGQNARLDAHLAACPLCSGRLASEQRLTRALGRLERASPSPEFFSRLDAALAARAAMAAPARPAGARRLSRLLEGVAALAALVLLVLFAGQAALTLQERGALEFITLLATHPDLLSTYPGESLSALFESLPLVESLLMVGLFVVTLVLGQRLLRPSGLLSFGDVQNG